MSITLADGTATLTLNPDLRWADENDWHPVEQTVDRSITGALIVQSSARLNGRPITLESGTNSDCVSLAVAEALQAYADQAIFTLTLTIRGVARSVAFRHHDAPAFSATPLAMSPDGHPCPLWRITLKLMEI
jgi:hypothetical protein